jgi:adenylate kinase
LRALLIAPPGAGKGTQGKRIAEIYDVPHVSSGELLREEVARQTSAGQKIAREVEMGDLVDDSLVSAVVFEKLAKASGGFILDGFPRTAAQAVMTEEWTVRAGMPLQAAIELRVPREELMSRIRRRGADSARSDDVLQTVLHRLDVYDRDSPGLLGFYDERGILVTVDGTGDVDDVTQRIRNQLDRVLAATRSNPTLDAPSN